MYIIIVGGGKIGYYLAKQLVEDGNEVLVIEKDAAKCQQIADDLGDIVLRGDGCEGVTLEAAGTGRADLFIAITGDDEDNLVACQVAKYKFNVRRTVALLNNPKNEPIFKKLGIDTTVSSTALVLANIEQELPSHPLIPLLTIKGGGLEIVEAKVPQYSAIVGKRVSELLLPQQCLITVIIDEEGVPRVPNSDTQVRAGDEVVAVCRRESEDALRAILTTPARETQ
ncbi:MAG: TrkA family potassium uptake protein [Dehalococcoidia bacterium]|nr:MAG: TrkA family potassium uptake protein [Dehalococcoidia bacterium]